MIKANADELVTLHLTLLDSSDDPITGEVNGGFSKRLYRRGATNAIVVTVTELGDGDYKATFTPDEAGHWHLAVRHTVEKREWSEDVAVGLDARADLAVVAATNSTALYVDMFLLRNNRQVLDATTATITLYDDTEVPGAVGTRTISADDLAGRFKGNLTLTTAIVDNRTYVAVVAITDPAGVVTTSHPVISVAG